jgi:hypothetical protein
VALNGILGEDYYGRFIMDKFKELNIDTTYIRLSKLNKTGISIAINPEKDRSFITYMGSNAEKDLTDLNEESDCTKRHINADRKYSCWIRLVLQHFIHQIISAFGFIHYVESDDYSFKEPIITLYCGS